MHIPSIMSKVSLLKFHPKWLKLYEAAILEVNPDEVVTRIGAAAQAIAQRESLLDITEPERRKLADARSMLQTLSRIALP